MKFFYRIILILSVVISIPPGTVWSQGFYYSSYQLDVTHRYEAGYVGGFWGHHLGHMVRTNSYGLWYVDDSGTNVNVDSSTNYYRFVGNGWKFIYSLSNPPTIQQNVTSLAIGDSIYSYGLNINSDYIEEAIFNAKTMTTSGYNEVVSTATNTNYIGAAVSPNGTRVIWWTHVVNNSGPSQWLYIYHDGTGWHGPISSSIPGNDFSYVFVSFLNDSTFYAGGEVPGGNAPNWTFSLGAGEVVLGQPLSGFTIMPGDNLDACDIWVNRANGDVHLFGNATSGDISYFYKPAGGSWPDSASYLPLPSVARCRLLDVPGDSLYLIISQNGFKTYVIDRASLTGAMDFSSAAAVPLNTDEGFTASYAIWCEAKEYQTAPVKCINFAFPGNDYAYSNILRNIQVFPDSTGIPVKISIPNGGESFGGSNTNSVSWFHKLGSSIDSVSLEWSPDDGSSWYAITRSVPNTGTYPWVIPDTNSTSCLLRIDNTANGNVLSVSDLPFEISYTPPSRPMISIIKPKSDTTIYVDSTISIAGTASVAGGYISDWEWYMGDGSRVHGLVSSFQHTYTAPGTYYLKLTVMSNTNLWSDTDSVAITVKAPTNIKEVEVPFHFELFQNYPNPFNPTTLINYSLARREFTRLEVFDLNGDLVVTLVNSNQDVGSHSVLWNGRDAQNHTVASGIYFCRLLSGKERAVRKLILIK